MSIEESHADGQVVAPYSPELARAEYRALAQRSALNLIGVQINGLSQDVVPTSYISPATGRPSDEAWLARRRLGMPEITRQAHRWAFIEGESYLAFVPTPTGWIPRAYQRAGVVVHWDDPINDQHPRTFIAPLRWERGHPVEMFAWDDDTGLSVWRIVQQDSRGTTWGPWRQSVFATQFFGGQLPVRRYISGEWSKFDGFWRPMGEVQPLIGAQKRVIQSIFDLLLTQQFGAVFIRTMAGIELPDPTGDDDVDAVRAEQHVIDMAANRILVAEDPEAKFGSLVGTPLNPFIDAVDAAIRHFSIIAAIAPMRTSGKIENVSADAITAARQAEEDTRQAYRDRWNDTEAEVTRMAMIAAGLGDPGHGGEIVWRETQLRSLSQIADAASKFVQAQVPVRPLIERSLQWSSYEVGQIGQQMAAESLARGEGVEAIVADRRERAGQRVRELVAARGGGA